MNWQEWEEYYRRKVKKGHLKPNEAAVLLAARGYAMESKGPLTEALLHMLAERLEPIDPPDDEG